MAELQPAATHHHTVIFLHGRDSTAQEFMEELFESQGSDDLTLPQSFPSTKWVFPTAPMITSSRFGCEMSQWFDMHSTEDPHEEENEQNLLPSIKRIQDIVAKEAAIVGPHNVVLAGISQGCATAIHALLSDNVRLGGFIGLCSWLPQSVAIKRAATEEAKRTPVLLCHSQDDEVINVRFGTELKDSLVAMGMEVAWKEYPNGGHWINEPLGIDDMVSFLEANNFA
jgi:predicted esterase